MRHASGAQADRWGRGQFLARKWGYDASRHRAALRRIAYTVPPAFHADDAAFPASPATPSAADWQFLFGSGGVFRSPYNVSGMPHWDGTLAVSDDFRRCVRHGDAADPPAVFYKPSPGDPGHSRYCHAGWKCYQDYAALFARLPQTPAVARAARAAQSEYCLPVPDKGP